MVEVKNIVYEWGINEIRIMISYRLEECEVQGGIGFKNKMIKGKISWSPLFYTFYTTSSMVCVCFNNTHPQNIQIAETESVLKMLTQMVRPHFTQKSISLILLV